MKILKRILILSLLIWPLEIAAQIDDAYLLWKREALAELSKTPIDEAGTTTYAYRAVTPEMRNLLIKRSNEADAFTAQHGNDPVVWWVLGELGRLKRGLYQFDLVKEGKTYHLDAPENQALIKEYQANRRKALDLDEVPDAPAHLTREMLGTMADDVLSPPDIKQRALKKELEIANAGSQPVDNPDYEWQTYEVLLGNYVEQKDYDKYLETVNEMIERFPDSSRMNELVEYKRQAEAAIEKRDREVAK